MRSSLPPKLQRVCNKTAPTSQRFVHRPRTLLRARAVPGEEVGEPWLVDEIWDAENNCLILYIHPGRIKWGVDLRELMGPVLYEKKSYSLVVRGEWTDLDGNKLGKDTIKKFRTVAEDRVRIELKDWKLNSPKADSGVQVSSSASDVERLSCNPNGSA